MEPASNAPAHGDGLTCTITSFGYKYGPAVDADWVADARILRNPFWEPALRPFTGFDQAVRDFVLEQPVARELVERLADMFAWVCIRASECGRSSVHLAVGCTGGRHRSVVIACELAARLEGSGATVTLQHRDVERPDPR